MITHTCRYRKLNGMLEQTSSYIGEKIFSSQQFSCDAPTHTLKDNLGNSSIQLAYNICCQVTQVKVQKIFGKIFQKAIEIVLNLSLPCQVFSLHECILNILRDRNLK